MKPKLSKSKFCAGVICQKRLWLTEHKPAVATPLSGYEKFLTEQGNTIEILSRNLFPDGINVQEDARSVEDRLLLTHTLLERGVPVIYQAAFVYDDVLIYSDIVRREPDGSYELYEVKSFSDAKKNINTTDITNAYINDLKIQNYVMSANNVRLSRTALMYLNKNYYLKGKLDLQELFCYWDLPLQNHENIQQIRSDLESLKKCVLSKTEPARELGAHCNKPNQCCFKKYCLSLRPDDSIYHFNLKKIARVKKYLVETHQDTIRKINCNDAKLQVLAPYIKAEQQKSIIVNKEELKQFLESFCYPLYFLDFETMQYAVPKFEGHKPYQRIPFQFSVHIQTHRESELVHREFFWSTNDDPSEAFARSLCEFLGTGGSIVTWSTYEAQVIKTLYNQFPEFKNRLIQIENRIIDLEVPFEKSICYLPGSYGYSSIKKILLLIDPNMSYQSLAIGSGDDAMLQYSQLLTTQDLSEKRQIECSLKQYCAQDTLAMARIYRWLLDN